MSALSAATVIVVEPTRPLAVAPHPTPLLDPESREWLRCLRASRPNRDASSDTSN